MTGRFCGIHHAVRARSQKGAKKHPGREELPARFPRIEKIMACTPEQCVCTNGVIEPMRTTLATRFVPYSKRLTIPIYSLAGFSGGLRGGQQTKKIRSGTGESVKRSSGSW